MTILFIDFETRSRCDLKAHGVYNYCLHGSTEVLCMSYAFDDGPVITWLPGQPFPEAVRNHTGLVYAHNATFERLVFWYILEIDFKLEQFYCTAAQARANCAPGSLEDVGRFAGASMRKDHRGAQLIRLLSIPQADGAFREDADLMREMVEYCERDVEAMRAISQSLRPLSAEELADYHVNEKINDRGVLVDVELCRAAMRYADAERVEIQELVVDLTKGKIPSVRSSKMREWVMARVGPTALQMMLVHKDGDPKYSIDKAVRANLLALAEENADEVPGHVADVIQCADDLWASSTAKFARLADLADEEDQRVRGAFVFAGGSATGRASSYGAQVHNFPRKAHKAAGDVRNSMVRGHQIVPQHGKRVSDVLKSMLRPALIPSAGNVLIVADWSAIEGRVHPWLTNSEAGRAKLRLFYLGQDPYCVNAAALYNTTYGHVLSEHEAGRSNMRQVGKVQELALGFLGGPGAFATFGRVYGVHLPDDEVRKAVRVWRYTNPWAWAHGSDLQSAYLRAMRNKGHEVATARTTYYYDGLHLWYALPSGRVLCYPHAKFDADGEVSYAKAAWRPAADAKKWPRARIWPGLACENLTQATANDLLRCALRRLDAEGYAVVLHVHDEIVVEVKREQADAAAARIREVMCTAPDWAVGLPLAVEVKAMMRYGK